MSIATSIADPLIIAGTKLKSRLFRRIDTVTSSAPLASSASSSTCWFG